VKRLLQLGFVLGIAGTFAAAHFLPWVEYERYRSEISTVANGGRVEQFMVRLPADRIGDPISAFGAADSDASGVRLEHFKLRDVAGNVIGIVARHELRHDGATETSWLLTIPSRGSIAMTSRSSGNALDAALNRNPLTAGQSLEAELSIDSPTPASSVFVSGEFEDITFELIETWVVTGLDDDGRLQGTLRLNTTGRSSS
jgi:hypothetical protein